MRRADGRVLEPVANVHLADAASVERINWLANPTAAGLSLSHGLMVNYRYDPRRIATSAASSTTRYA